MRHWPEKLLAFLFLIGGVAPQICLSGPLWLRALMIPIGWLLAFGLWAAIIWVVCWLNDRRTRQPDA
jgi:hypothetical protein